MSATKTKAGTKNSWKIRHVLDEFPFEAVHRHMQATGWIWVPLGRVPTVQELKDHARDMLIEAEKVAYRHYRYACGGFWVERLPYEQDGFSELTLSFRPWTSEAIIQNSNPAQEQTHA